MCERWDDFENFLIDMGGSYCEGLTLERKKVNEGYNPENCVWADRFTQMRNVRTNHVIDFNGQSMIATDWAKSLGLTLQGLLFRIEKWGLEEALSKPKGFTPELSDSVKSIRALYDLGVTNAAEIARRLDIPHSTVKDNIRKYKKEFSSEDRQNLAKELAS